MNTMASRMQQTKNALCWLPVENSISENGDVLAILLVGIQWDQIK